jgi:transcription elongation GreA/GreB family factor
LRLFSLLTSLYSVKKTAILQCIIASFDAELETYAQSARAAHEEATHEQSRAENKYDTRGLEASYLAHGQSRQAAETLRAREEYASLVLKDFGPDAPIDLGAVVEFEENGRSLLYFIGPRAGGREVVHQRKTILVITPQSPLGGQLVGHKKGEQLLFQIGGTCREGRILNVS